MPSRSRRKGSPRPEPSESAQAAGLRYVSDTMPGISRKRAGTGFTYVDPDGKRITDQSEIARIRSLAIPPAYTDVWICPHPNGHIQATGRDARGPQAVPLPPTMAGGPGRDQVRADAGVQPGAAGDPGAGVEGRGDRPDCTREKVLATVVQPARVHRDPGGERRVRPGQPVVRAHHAAGPPRGDLRLEAAVPVPGQEREGPRRGADRPAAGADRRSLPGDPRGDVVPVRGRGRRAADGGLGGRERVPPGDHRAGLHGEGFPHLVGDAPRSGRAPGRWGPRPPSGKRSRSSSGRSTRWPISSTTPGRCAGSITSTRRCSRPTWRGRCWPRWATETRRPPRRRRPDCRTRSVQWCGCSTGKRSRPLNSRRSVSGQ